jgi:glycosyltransferase involved in cell wall biosynthesis
VICVARIEPLKNQLALIRALNNTPFKLLIIGVPAKNHKKYYTACKEAAGNKVTFTGYLSQEQLIPYYERAKVHVLPSWFETTGLSSLEAAAMGCNIVITDKGDTKEYFENYAFYCDPASPESIYEAIRKASVGKYDEGLRNKIFSKYTWQQAANKTLAAYREITGN